MLCNPTSFYPAKIDPLLFFQDVNLEKLEVMNTYDNLIKKGEFSKANEYINSQEGICGYFADFLNAIENRICSLQEHLLTIGPRQPFVYSDEEPLLVKGTGTYGLLSDYTNEQLNKYTHTELVTFANSRVSNEEIIWI